MIDIGDELARKGKWLAVVNQATGQGRRVRLYIRVKPVLLSLVGLMVAGYLVAAVALVGWLDRNPFNRVGFFDVTLPWRWTSLNALRGEGYSAQGVKELEGGNGQRALFFLQRGLSLNPDDASTRLIVAKYYAQGNYYPGVKRTIMPQLKWGYSRPLLEVLFTQAAQADDTKLILTVAEEMRASVGAQAEETPWLDEWRVITLLHNNEGKAALRIIAENGYKQGKWEANKVNGLIATGDLDQALAVALAMPPAFPGVFPLALHTQARVLSERRDRDGLLAVLDRFLGESMRVPESWNYAIEQLVKAELYDDVAEFMQGFLLRYGGQPETVSAMLMRVADTGDSRAIELALAQTAGWQAPTVEERMGLIWALVREGQWTRLTSTLSEDGEQVNEYTLALVRALTSATNDSTQTEGLNAWLGRGRLNLKVYLFLAEGLAVSEHWNLVKMVGQVGQRHYPDSTSLAKIMAQNGERWVDPVPDSRLNEVMTAVRTTYEAADVRELKVRLRGWVEAENWKEVESLVLRVRRQRPAWMNEIEPALDEADARAGAARGDVERLTRLAPAVLRRNRAMADMFTDAAARAVQAGQQKQAVSLLEAMLKDGGIFPQAWSLLKAITAPPEPVVGVESDEVEVPAGP